MDTGCASDVSAIWSPSRDVGSAALGGMGMISGDTGPGAQIVSETWLDGCD